MTNLFFDFEFTGLHQKTTPISLGIVSECGKKSFYAEFTDYSLIHVDEWLEENVISKLLLNHLPKNKLTGRLQNQFKIRGDTSAIVVSLKAFLQQFDGVKMWGDVCAYDWVVFCELFGGAFNIPKNVYYIPFDIATLLESTGNADFDREVFSESISNFSGNKHNALYDANIIRNCHTILTCGMN